MPDITEQLKSAAARAGIKVPSFEAPQVEAPAKKPSGELEVVLEPMDENEKVIRKILTYYAYWPVDGEADTVGEVTPERIHEIAIQVFATTRRAQWNQVVRNAKRLGVSFTFEEATKWSPTFVAELLEQRMFEPTPSAEDVTRWMVAKKVPFAKVAKVWTFLPVATIDDDLILAALAVSTNEKVRVLRGFCEHFSGSAVKKIAMTRPQDLFFLATHPDLTDEMVIAAFDATDYPERYQLVNLMRYRDMSGIAVGKRVREVLASLRETSPRRECGSQAAIWILKNWKITETVDLISLGAGKSHTWYADGYPKNIPTVAQLYTVVADSENLSYLVSHWAYGGTLGVAARKFFGEGSSALLESIAEQSSLGPTLRRALQVGGKDQLERPALRALEYAMRDCSDVVRERVWNSLAAESSIFEMSAKTLNEIVQVFVDREREAAARLAIKAEKVAAKNGPKAGSLAVSA
jgi:hypothetical protein